MLDIPYISENVIAYSCQDNTLSTCSNSFLIHFNPSQLLLQNQNNFFLILKISNNQIILNSSLIQPKNELNNSTTKDSIILLHPNFFNLFNIEESEKLEARFYFPEFNLVSSILKNNYLLNNEFNQITNSESVVPLESIATGIKLNFVYIYNIRTWNEQSNYIEFCNHSFYFKSKHHLILIESFIIKKFRNTITFVENNSYVIFRYLNSYLVFRVEFSQLDKNQLYISPSTNIKATFTNIADKNYLQNVEESIDKNASQVSINSLKYLSHIWSSLNNAFRLLSNMDTYNLAPKIINLFGTKGSGKSYFLSHLYSNYCLNSINKNNNTKILWLDINNVSEKRLDLLNSLNISSTWYGSLFYFLALISDESFKFKDETSLKLFLENKNFSIVFIIDNLDILLNLFKESNDEDEEEENNKVNPDNTPSLFLNFMNNSCSSNFKGILYHLGNIFQNINSFPIQFITSSSISTMNLFPIHLRSDIQYILNKPSITDRKLIIKSYFESFNRNSNSKKIILSPINGESESIEVWSQNISILTKGFNPGALIFSLDNIISMSESQMYKNNLLSDNKQNDNDIVLYWDQVSRMLSSLSLDNLQNNSKFNIYQDDNIMQLTWDNFIGYKDQIKKLKRFIKPILLLNEKEINALNETKVTDSFLSSKISSRIPKGMIIYGPSGCGKSYLAKIIASQLKMNLIIVNSSDLLSKYFGQTEAKIRKYFQRAKLSSPCVLFFDDFDSIAHKRSLDSNGDSSHGSLSNRVLSTFLNELDGISGSNSSKIFVIAASLNIESLDEALIRPGRLQHHVKLTYPSQEEIQDILISKLNELTMENPPLREISKILFEEKTSTSEIFSFITKVKLESIKDLIKSNNSDQLKIENRVFKTCLQHFFPYYTLDEIENKLKSIQPQIPVSTFKFEIKSDFTFNF